jgi:site-specific DNA-methyltransferase (adenine-specific)
LEVYYKDEYVELFQGNCLEIMDKMIEKGIKVEAIITDTPYGTTSCKWDSIIPLNDMWKRLNDLIKNNGAIVLFSQEPFTNLLIASNIDKFKYKWIWQKTKPTGFPMANYRPLKSYEEISLFTEAPCTYVKNGSKGTYNPQGLQKCDKIKKRTNRKHLITSSNGGNMESEYRAKYKNYPQDIITFSNGKKKNIHPCEKPIELIEYLIKTYTNEGDTILDFTCGSSTTLVASQNTNRKCYGIELEEEYCEISKKRLEENLLHIKKSI